MTRKFACPRTVPAPVQAFARTHGMARLSSRALLLAFRRHNLAQAERLAQAVDTWAALESETRDAAEALTWESI